MAQQRCCRRPLLWWLLVFLIFLTTLVPTWSLSFFNDERLFRTWVQVKKFKEDFDTPISLIKIALVGVQSAGKSTLIDCIVRFPVSFTAFGTGTRCPVLFRLRHKASASVPIVHIQNRRVTIEEVAVKVFEHMSKVEAEEGFSLTPLVFQIESSDVPDLDLIDVPGIIPTPKPEQKQMASAIRKIQAEYLRDPDVFVVAVVRTTDQIQVNTDLDVLGQVATEVGLGSHPPRPDWQSDTLIVANKMEQFANGHDYSSWQSIADANAFFQEAREAKGKVIFIHPKVHLNQPYRGINVTAPRDSAPLDEKLQFLKNLQEYEQQWFEDVIRGLKTKDSFDTWNPLNAEMFGVARVVDSMSEHWKLKFVADLPKLGDQIRKRNKHLEAEEIRVADALQAADVANLRMKLFSFSIVFLQQYQAFLSMDMDVVQSKMHKNVDGLSTSYSYYDVNIHGRTYKEELELAAADHLECDWILPHERIASELGEDEFKMNWRMFGVASYSRSLNVMAWMMFFRNFSHYSNAQISNMAESMGHCSGTVPANKLVTSLANAEVKGLSRGIDWYLAFVQKLFTSYGSRVVTHLISQASGEYGVVGQMRKFINKLQTRLQDIIRGRLQEVKVQWNKDLKRFTTVSPFDMMSRMLMSVVAFPFDNFVWNMDNTRSRMALPGRADKVLEAIRSLVDYADARNDMFDTADMVKGGYFTPRPQDPNMLEFDYIRSTASGIYKRLCFTLAEAFRASMYTEFISVMTDRTELQKEFTRLVADYDDAALMELIHENPEELKRQLNKTSSELAAAKQLLLEIDDLQNSLWVPRPTTMTMTTATSDATPLPAAPSGSVTTMRNGWLSNF